MFVKIHQTMYLKSHHFTGINQISIKFAIKHKTNAKIEALLPNRVRRKKVILDDDF